MTQEDRQLVLKDICAKLVYRLKVQYKGKTYYLLGLDIGRIFVNLARVGEWLPAVFTFDIKPYLRPMSSMTEEERHDLEEIVGKDVEISDDFINIVDSSRKRFSFLELQAMFDWLNKNMFDYRGLIHKGLALKAPKDMYKEKDP